MYVVKMSIIQAVWINWKVLIIIFLSKKMIDLIYNMLEICHCNVYHNIYQNVHYNVYHNVYHNSYHNVHYNVYHNVYNEKQFSLVFYHLKPEKNQFTWNLLFVLFSDLWTNYVFSWWAMRVATPLCISKCNETWQK